MSDQAAAWFKQLLDSVKRCVLRPGRGYRVKSTPEGQFIELDFEGGGPGRKSAPVSVALRKFTLVTMGFDTLLCTAPGSSEQIYVAKSTLLRNSITTETLDSILHTYSYAQSRVQRTAAVSGAGTEAQVIVPRFKTGDSIYAAQLETPVALSHNPAAATVTVEWIDANIDGRAWSNSSL